MLLKIILFIITFYIIPIILARFGLLVTNYINNRNYSLSKQDAQVIVIPIINVILVVCFIIMGIYWFGLKQPIQLITPWFMDPTSFWKSVFKPNQSNK